MHQPQYIYNLAIHHRIQWLKRWTLCLRLFQFWGWLPYKMQTSSVCTVLSKDSRPNGIIAMIFGLAMRCANVLYWTWTIDVWLGFCLTIILYLCTDGTTPAAPRITHSNRPLPRMPFSMSYHLIFWGDIGKRYHEERAGYTSFLTCNLCHSSVACNILSCNVCHQNIVYILLYIYSMRYSI